MPAFTLDSLRRWPDVEAPNLVAVDATDRLLLEEAADAVRRSPDQVAVIDDHHGAITLGAVALLGASGVRVHQDSLVGARALAANAAATGLLGTFAQHTTLGADLLAGARVVLLQLPKSLAALQEITELVAAHAADDVVVYAGGRVKHMTPSMTDVLRLGFDDVHATLARQKSRVLVARGPRGDTLQTFPRVHRHDDLAITVCAHGGAFSGTKIDLGTRFLMSFSDRMGGGAGLVGDLGCGTGVLASVLARERPELRVLATDASAAAVASASATIRANELLGRVAVTRDDAAASVGTGQLDLVLCNPPFHLGTTVLDAGALRLFSAAARVLRPGGTMWTVFNTPLGYRAALDRVVGPTKVAGRDPRFTVTVSTRGRAAARSAVRGPR